MSASTNTGNSAPAFSGSSREGAVDGNTSGAAGSRGGAPPSELRFVCIAANEPTRGTGPKLTTATRIFSCQEPTLGEQMGITMPADTKIISNEREGDHVEPNVLPGESLSTAGPGGDMRQREAQEHELKGMKQRLENDDERASREALGKDEPISRVRCVLGIAPWPFPAFHQALPPTSSLTTRSLNRQPPNVQ